ncbi:TldD/PmbA family protein [Phocea massiliensis]|uniref:TldD/PmbA family protein n=1 Tax=Merdimmobilis hominis TaxID=2897707 RepID=A0A938X6N5_9FIRM|nr:TldD/PmbA family protein [Merdimmobilis hominis]MBM6919639.1 TldD/PmbA family protein [Merdimmobilis hominis]
MNQNEMKQIISDAAAKAGINEYELYFEEAQGTDVTIFEREVKEFSSEEVAGVCFRCLTGNNIGYASTELFTEDELAALPARALENAKLIESGDAQPFYKAGDTYRPVVLQSRSPLASSSDYIHTAMEAQEAAYAADDRITTGTETSCGGVRKKIWLFNSNGLDFSADYGYDVLVSGPVARDGEESTDGMTFAYGKLSELDAKNIAKTAVSRAVSKLHAKQQTSGQMPVVFSGEQMCTILSAFLSVFSADAAQKGLSLLSGKENETIASPCVTLIDDPFYKDSPVQMSFDAEGVATFTKPVIENGVLKTLLHNRKTAQKAGVASTANGAKHSYADAVSISPYCFYLQPGDASFDTLIDGIESGVYITALKGLHAGANAITGDFSIDSEGFTIENGKLGGAVRSFTVAGNFFDLLKNIRGFDNAFYLDYPSGVTVLGSADALVDGLTIAGK